MHKTTMIRNHLAASQQCRQETCTPEEGVANSLVTWSEELQGTTAVPASAADLKEPVISGRHSESDECVS